MSKPYCSIVLRPDGLALMVRIIGDHIVVEVCMMERYYDDKNAQALEIMVREALYCQEFDVSALSWRAECNVELLEKWIRDKIEKSGFRNFAGLIAQLAQKLAAQSEAYSRATAA